MHNNHAPLATTAGNLSSVYAIVSAECSESASPNDGRCSCSCSDGFDQDEGLHGLLCQSEPHLYKVPKQVMT